MWFLCCFIIFYINFWLKEYVLFLEWKANKAGGSWIQQSVFCSSVEAAKEIVSLVQESLPLQ